MARAIWKGSISFGLVNIPVALYPAEKRTELHFNLIDSRNHARVRYEKVNEATGEEVPWEEIVRGYEYGDGNYVLLADEDFRRADVKASQTIEIEDFVDRDAVPYAYFDKPYYLVPTKGGEKGYALLRETLRRTGKIGIARVVIRTREYLSAVIPEGKALVLELLRYGQEIRGQDELEFPGEELEKYRISEKELKMAETLVGTMYSGWDPDRYRDAYRDALMAWIRKKIETGQTEVTPEAEEEAPRPTKVIDMMKLLQKSVETASRKEKGPEDAGHRGETRSHKKRGAGGGRKRASGAG
jgi:DNA end-binding protein Ku